MDTKAEFQKLTTTFASLLEKMKKSNADMGEDSKPEMDDMMEMCSNLSRRMEYMAEAFWDYTFKHNKNHVPPLKSASNLKAFLKACDMEDEYEVVKPSLFVSASKDGVITINYSKKNEK